MASKEDILEQIAEDYLIHKGYFVQHNLKFKPATNYPEFNSQSDSNHSDIDVVGYHSRLEGFERVVAVSCKSWQNGLHVSSRLRAYEENRVLDGKDAWKGFRELLVPKWNRAFIAAIEDATGQTNCTHVTAVTVLRGKKDKWESVQTVCRYHGPEPSHDLDTSGHAERYSARACENSGEKRGRENDTAPARIEMDRLGWLAIDINPRRIGAISAN